MQRDLSMPQCIPLTLLERGGGGILDPCRGGQIQKFGGWDLIEAKANILNKKLKFLHCAVEII